MEKLSQYIDHTLLKPDAGCRDILRLCDEAVRHGLYAVCVNSCHTALAAQRLAGTGVRVATVVGFPLGACAPQVKAFEAEYAAGAGAHELDMVLDVGALKEGRLSQVASDIQGVVAAADPHGALVKVILETCLLSDEEIWTGCRLSREAGAAFVKTSTGFSSGGATVRHVALMKEAAGPGMRVKASGGIRTRETALAMIRAGADRIGCSASLNIIKEEE